MQKGLRNLKWLQLPKLENDFIVMVANTTMTVL